MYDLVNQIYHTDCFPFMRQLPDDCIQLILTDPPYGVQYQNNYAYTKHPKIVGDSGIDYMMFARQCYRILQDNSHAYFFTRYDKYPFHYGCLTEAGFKVKNCLVIEKGQVGGIGDLHGSYANNSEWVIFCHKGRRLFNETRLLKNVSLVGKKGSRLGNPVKEYKTRFNSCWFGIDYPKSTYNATFQRKTGIIHPTIKNVECLEWLIRISSNESDIVFDPFLGSGSTAIAAHNTGRYYLGTEIDKNYFQLSMQRLGETSIIDKESK